MINKNSVVINLKVISVKQSNRLAGFIILLTLKILESFCSRKLLGRFINLFVTLSGFSECNLMESFLLDCVDIY